LAFKSAIALSSAFLAFFCSVVSTFFFALIPAATETPVELAAVAGTATPPAINDNAAAKEMANLVVRERKFIYFLMIGREVDVKRPRSLLT
jgi:hypothetical protein